jgi:hypothetical protein
MLDALFGYIFVAQFNPVDQEVIAFFFQSANYSIIMVYLFSESSSTPRIFFQGDFMKYLFSLFLFSVGTIYSQSFSQESPATVPAQTSLSTSPGFSVDSIAIAGNIEQRMPVGIESQFPWDVGRVSCWISVSSSQAPVPIKFVWYKNDELISEWPYSLLSETGRVWSTKAVASGKWRVEIVDAAKTVVKTASFEVKEHTM